MQGIGVPVDLGRSGGDLIGKGGLSRMTLLNWLRSMVTDTSGLSWAPLRWVSAPFADHERVVGVQVGEAG